MYSEEDLTAAVEAGVVDAKTASTFREFVEARRSGSLVDEEHFRLLTGFSDIFVTIGVLLLLIPAISLVSITGNGQTGFLVGAALAWALAEHFTRKRRQALPSITLAIAFVLCIALMGFTAVYGGGNYFGGGLSSVARERSASSLLPGFLGMAAAAGHWFRFRVPITVAIGTLSLHSMIVALLAILIPNLYENIDLVVLVLGILTFAFAMVWDIRDTTRTTRRSDVAFWLHLCAAPMLVHPVFESLVSDVITPLEAVAVIALYLVTIVLALAIDRRALLVSAAIYVLYALSETIDAATTDMKYFLASLILGVLLLTVSVSWMRARRAVVQPLPEPIKRHLPKVA